MKFTESLTHFLSDLIGEDKRFKTNADLARFCEVDPSYTHRLLKGIKGKKHLEAFAGVLDKLGATIRPPNEQGSREICFINNKIAEAGSQGPPPNAEDYIAVPMVGEVGAGPGIIPEDKIESWVLVWRNHHSVQRRSNLLAVEIGKNQRSMVPTLHPGDVVLVDRDDCGQDTIRPPGNIFLVREPGQEGGGKVKRVSLSGKRSNAILTFYSDNAEENEPEPHILSQDYDNDLRIALVGRVIWAWADLGRK